MIARDIGDVPDDPHLQAVGFFQRTEHPSEGVWLQMKHPVRFSAFQPQASQPPMAGEHGDEIRADVKRRR